MNSAVEIFYCTLRWLQQNYFSFRFYTERDVVWTIQQHAVQLSEDRQLGIKVFNDHPIILNDKRARVDLAFVDKHDLTVLALEFKYEPSHQRKDILPTKFPVVFWAEVKKDIDRIHCFVESGKAQAAFSVLIDEGGYFRKRLPPYRSRWIDWDCGTIRGVSLLLSEAAGISAKKVQAVSNGSSALPYAAIRTGEPGESTTETKSGKIPERTKTGDGMERMLASACANLLRTSVQKVNSYELKSVFEEDKPIVSFQQWADGKRHVGIFEAKNEQGKNYYFGFIEWQATGRYYLVIFPESKLGTLAEIHRVAKNGDQINLCWTYSPIKRDGRNKERKSYFEKYFSGTEVRIALPRTVAEIERFLDQIFALCENRLKADALAMR